MGASLQDVIEGREPYALVLGTAEEALSLLPSESVDAVVTDPPFGIGFTFGDAKEEASTPAAYWEWFAPIHRECLRVLKPGGFYAFWQSQLYFRFFWEWFGDGIHIYCAAKNFVQLRGTPVNFGYDPVVVGYKPGPLALRPEKPDRNIDFYLSNTAGIVSQTKRIERGHPCPKPLDLMLEIVKNFTLPGGVILDPFMGSGSTGLAARVLGSRFIGIEMHPPFFRIAQTRIEMRLTQHNQASLWDAPEPERSAAA